MMREDILYNEWAMREHGKMLEKQHQERLTATEIEIKKFGDFYFQKIQEWMSDKFQKPIEKINQMIWSGQIKLFLGTERLVDFLFEYFEIKEHQKIFIDRDRMLHLIRTGQIDDLNFELFTRFGTNIIFFK